ncbi:MAG TPA: Si-specific NAD(P)(+) transhydrogenase [Candidatus Binatia bacterium]|nr:Si-specific NAD(P)(+) transhydrogenase [Candidatus Binatia bacterium]
MNTQTETMSPTTTAYDYDLVVVGSGPAGEKAAIQAAKLDKRVAVIERGSLLGGACTHTATLPSKTLREAVLFIAGLEQRSFPGIQCAVKKHRMGVQDLLRYKTAVVQHQADAVRRKLDRNDVDVFHGQAIFLDPHRLVIESSDGARRTCTAAVMILAVGSRPARPETIPFDDVHVFDTDSILHLDRIPRTLAVIGAGVVGCEYASIFAALGVKVTLLDTRSNILDFLDDELKQRLLYRMLNAGVVMHFGEEVTAVAVPEVDRIEARCGSGKVVTAERVLYAAGRVGNTDALGLSGLGLETDQRGLLQVDENFQTVIPHIYAVGDVIGFPALAATAMHQGRLASVHAFRASNGPTDGKTSPSPLAPLPFGIYTIPEVSMVGATEEELTEARVPYEIGHAFYRETARAHIMGDTEGMLKLIFHRETLQLLGVHIIGEHASELIHVGQAVMAYGGTIEYFIDNVVNYPTLSEAYKVAALNGYNRL